MLALAIKNITPQMADNPMRVTANSAKNTRPMANITHFTVSLLVQIHGTARTWETSGCMIRLGFA